MVCNNTFDYETRSLTVCNICGISISSIENKLEFASYDEFNDHIHVWDVLVKYRCFTCNKQIRPSEIFKTNREDFRNIKNYCSEECVNG